MSKPAITRLFWDKSLRFGKAGSSLILIAFILFSALNLGARSWNTFHPFVANDGVTLIYAQFARNLLRYPFSDTFGLMADLVGDPAKSLTLGEPRTVYVDHPSGTVWLIALVNRFAVEDPIIAARAMNIVAAIGTAVAILVFIYRRTSPLPAVGGAVVLVTLPLFWEHSVVANFEPATLFFTLAAAISFIGYLSQPSYGRIAATILLWMGGMLCDWPAYFLGGPIAAALIYQRRWGSLLLFTAIGIGTMAAVIGQLKIGPAGFPTVAFFYGTGEGMLAGPFGALLYRTFDNLVRGFALWCCLLVLPFVTIVWRGRVGAPLKELQFLFLSFLFVGVANDIIFYRWAGEHSFWSYYLIPAACTGAALLFQWFPEWEPESLRNAPAMRVGLLVLFAFCAVSGAAATRNLIKPHFSRPPSVAEMLGERHLADLLDPDSVILIGPYCRQAQSPAAGGTHWPDNMPLCSIYTGQGAKARYWIDHSALTALDFDPQKMKCNTTFIVLKGPSSLPLLTKLSLTATEVPWFDWFVLRLSDLPSVYCDRPSRLFEELGREAAGSAGEAGYRQP